MSDTPIDTATETVATLTPTAPPPGGDTQVSVPASEDTSATPAKPDGEKPEQSRRESRAFATIRRENRELNRTLGRLEARLEALGQPAPAEGDPAPTRPSPAPSMAAREADQEAAQVVVERLEDALDKMDDGDEVMKKITKPNFPITPVMRDFLGESDQPGQMAKWLADNPDEARRISRLTDAVALRALERAEAKVAKPASRKTTGAPPPVPTVGGRSSPTFDAEKSSMDEYAAHWKARQAARGN